MDYLKTFIPCLSLLLMLSMISFSEAKDLVVGGKKSSWQVPSSPDKYNKWAESKRFKIGDSIVLKYDGKTGSVLQVTEENYKSYNKANPIESYSDGNTRITLDKAGSFYLISGAEGHCEKGEKMEIRVLSVKHGHSPVAPVPSPAEDHRHYAPKKNDSNELLAKEAGEIETRCEAVSLAYFRRSL